jgi:hypothetical protein
MDRIRIDRQTSGLRLRRQHRRDEAAAAAAAPLHRTPAAPTGADDEVLARIDAALDEQAATARR